MITTRVIAALFSKVCTPTKLEFLSSPTTSRCQTSSHDASCATRAVDLRPSIKLVVRDVKNSLQQPKVASSSNDTHSSTTR
ncbi:hypothetical protein SCHPADRAFT_288365 [Schizopora paradoxa]|uniref:Uncharacterized protein n=1 Tax=Schizopora paradoxa TaxID=27342 RepID=A0A0H2SDG1_9AGAM|nr:hypothetical protein SCHPADRAFT_288365 [Schizopora paradoxa]